MYNPPLEQPAKEKIVPQESIWRDHEFQFMVCTLTAITCFTLAAITAISVINYTYYAESQLAMKEGYIQVIIGQSRVWTKPGNDVVKK